MFGKDDIKRLEQKIDELNENVGKLFERQNSQYTDIMLLLKSLQTDPEPTRDIEDLYEEAKEAILEDSNASTSYLQRMLRIGYAKAARLMEMLEERGVVSPGEGSQPRKVISPTS